MLLVDGTIMHQRFRGDLATGLVTGAY